ncbi:hypothetical protein SFRURICE_003981 [Spodoptera frugiperda]|nr:hypothetical protein SFRURICE_003981 [Spodoptera frugiperda]
MILTGHQPRGIFDPLLLFLYFDISSVTFTVNTNQTTPIKLKSIESFRLEINTNQTTPLKPKSIKPFRLQIVPRIIHTYIHTLEIHNPPFWRSRVKTGLSATNGCASRNKIGALGEVRFKTVALRGIPHSDNVENKPAVLVLKYRISDIVITDGELYIIPGVRNT